ncbi:hypothetical protein FRC07_008835 [Ceratobasidium sp. 392]|nr:hypothetical protein FRC07_008835 [Ceratobasidium sp. 392]
MTIASGVVAAPFLPPSPAFKTYGTQEISHPFTKHGIKGAKAFLESKLGFVSNTLAHKTGPDSDIAERGYPHQRLNGLTVANAATNVTLKNNKVGIILVGAVSVSTRPITNGLPGANGDYMEQEDNLGGLLLLLIFRALIKQRVDVPNLEAGSHEKQGRGRKRARSPVLNLQASRDNDDAYTEAAEEPDENASGGDRKRARCFTPEPPEVTKEEDLWALRCQQHWERQGLTLKLPELCLRLSQQQGVFRPPTAWEDHFNYLARVKGVTGTS